MGVCQCPCGTLTIKRSRTGAAKQPRHVGLGPGFVDEDQLRRIKPGLAHTPCDAGFGDVGPILLGGVDRLFL